MGNSIFERKIRKNFYPLLCLSMIILFIIAWWFCWITTPFLINARCMGGSYCGVSSGGGGGGTSGGGVSGGSSGGESCPCDDCRAGEYYDKSIGYCRPIPVCETPATGGLTDCCPFGYAWDEKYMQCLYSGDGNVPLEGMSSASLSGVDGASAQLIAGGICPENAYFDLYEYKCMCNRGYTMDISTGCCTTSVVN